MAIQFLNTVAVDTDVLYVDTANNRVGIGEPNPDYELHVDGQIYSKSSTFPVYFLQRETSITGDGTFTTTSGIASGFHLRTNSSGTIQDGFGGGVVFSLTDSGTASNTAARIYARRDGGNTTGALQFWGGLDGNSPLMTMRASGKVGIGTTNPGGKLHVATPDPATNFIAIDFRNPNYGIYAKSNSISGRGNKLEFTATDYNSGGTVLTKDLLTLRPEGNIGIGTTSPNTLLDVSSANFGTTAPTIRITNTLNVGDWSGVTSDLGRFEFFTDDSSGNAPYTLGYIGIKNDNTTGSPTLPSGAMVFATTTYNASGGAVERMRIDSSGNVGIGTDAPSQKLTIRDDSATVYSTGDAGTNTGDFVLQNNNETNDNFNRISFQSNSDNNQTGDLLDAARITAIYPDHAGSNPSGELAFETKADAGRKASFCARMSGVVKNAKGDAPRAKAALKNWNC